jgi:hypothetical protein
MGVKAKTKLKIGNEQIFEEQSEVEKILAESYTQKLGANLKQNKIESLSTMRIYSRLSVYF